MKYFLLFTLLSFCFKDSIDAHAKNHSALIEKVFNIANKTYIIDTNLNLNGDTVIMPKGCTLLFEGGSINNGTVIGCNTIINAPASKIFECNLAGSWVSDRVYAEWWGAKGDGHSDDTFAVQSALNFLNDNSGGTLQLLVKVYMVSCISTKIKTSIVGQGKGASIIKQLPFSTNHCIIIPATSAAFELRNFSILGNYSNTNRSQTDGIYFENTNPGVENKIYTESLFNSSNKIQAYKWIRINNIRISKFNVGLYIQAYTFDLNISDNDFDYCSTGVFFGGTDSSIYNCYIANNYGFGLNLTGSNNRVSNLKIIFNGLDNPSSQYAFNVTGSRNLINNIETQDNYCSGFFLGGNNNLVDNCLTNNDGYVKEPKGYDPKFNMTGFYIASATNSYHNLSVSNYTAKYGATLKMPYIIPSEIQTQLTDLDINMNSPFGLCHEPTYNNILIPNKNIDKVINSKLEDGGILTNDSFQPRIVSNMPWRYDALYCLVDFDMNNAWINGNTHSLISLNDDDFSFYIGRDGLDLKIRSVDILHLDKGRLNSNLTNRIMFCFYTVRKESNVFSHYVSLSYYGLDGENGYKLYTQTNEISSELFVLLNKSVNNIHLGSNGTGSAWIKQFLITQSPINNKYLVLNTNLQQCVDSAILFFNANTYIDSFLKDTGTSSERPNASSLKGKENFQYFDKTLGKPIWWNGTKWINAMGIEVK